MTTFKVSIEETLCRTIEIKATNDEEAEEKAIEMYNNEEIVLNADDCYLRQMCIENTKTNEVTDWHEI